MSVWFIFSVLLALIYAAIMLTYWLGWRLLPPWQIPSGWQAQTRVTVLIPARNEVGNIEACLRSILEGSYPSYLTDILVLDDFSTDGTDERVWQFVRHHSPTTAAAIRVIRLADYLPAEAATRANKKTAIEIGVSQAEGPVIVTTDADCVAGKEWLIMMVSRLENKGRKLKPVLVTGPVVFYRERNLLQRFQALDFLGMMGITGAGIHLGFQRMGNGASLAYYREVFQSVRGYEDNRTTASGDDVFLIQKVAAKYPGRVAFVKSEAAVVRTEAAGTWHAFLQQRLRWGTKNAGLPEWPVRLVLLGVFLFCWSIWISAAAAFFSKKALQVLVIQVLVKAVFDWILLREMCRFFRRAGLMRWFLPSFVLHTFYIPFVGTMSLFSGKYEWKKRKDVT